MKSSAGPRQLPGAPKSMGRHYHTKNVSCDMVGLWSGGLRHQMCALPAVPFGLEPARMKRARESE